MVAIAKRFEVNDVDIIGRDAFDIKLAENYDEYKRGTLKAILIVGWIEHKLHPDTNNFIVNPGNGDIVLPLNRRKVKMINDFIDSSINNRCYFFYDEEVKNIGFGDALTEEDLSYWERLQAGDEKLMAELWWALKNDKGMIK